MKSQSVLRGFSKWWFLACVLLGTGAYVHAGYFSDLMLLPKDGTKDQQLSDVPDFKSCATECSKNQACRHWTWMRDSRKCILWQGGVTSKNDKCCVSGPRESSGQQGAGAASPSAPPALGILRDTNFVGSDITFIPDVRDSESCAQACSRNSACQSWSWVKPGRGIFGTGDLCWLKERVIEPTHDTCCDSGYAKSARPSGQGTNSPSAPPALGIFRNTDFKGSDIQFIPGVRDAESCAQECSRNSACQSWTWIRPGYGPLGAGNLCCVKDRLIEPQHDACCDSGYAKSARPSGQGTNTNAGTNTIPAPPTVNGSAPGPGRTTVPITGDDEIKGTASIERAGGSARVVDNVLDEPVPGSSKIVNRDGIACTQETRKLDIETDNLVPLDPTSDMIWAGAIYPIESVLEGGYAPVNLPRRDIRISTSLMNVGWSEVVVTNPGIGTVRDAIRELISSGSGQEAAANWQVKVHSINSQKDFKVKVAGSFSSPFAKASALFDFKKNSKKSRVLVDIYRDYYTITARPVDSGGFFSDPSLVQPDWVYVGTVTYGKRIMIGIESSTDQEALLQEAKAKFSAIAASGSVSESILDSNILKTAKLNALAFGVTGKELGQYIQAATAIEGSAQNLGFIARALANEESVSASKPGVPMSYVFNFVDNDEYAKVVTNAEYTYRSCGTLATDIRVDLVSLFLREDEDDGPAEVYGSLDVKAYDGNRYIPPRTTNFNTSWLRQRNNPFRMHKLDEKEINRTVTFEFPEEGIRNGTAYIKVDGAFYDNNGDSGDSTYRTRASLRLNIRDIVSGEVSPSALMGKGGKLQKNDYDKYVAEKHGGLYQTMFTAKDEQKLILLYRVSPVK